MEVPAGLHRRADTDFVQMRAHYGIPILQKSFFWDGNGEVDNFGGGLHVFHFLADDLALGIGTNVVTWLVPGPDVFSAELEGVLRWFPDPEWPLFFDLNAGYQHSTDPIPPGGTEWNFSFGFGPGVDLPLDPHTSLLVGAAYHHISNALGRESERNPSQNECRIWIGLGWDF